MIGLLLKPGNFTNYRKTYIVGELRFFDSLLDDWMSQV
jgi:hypothetical protein